MQNKLGYKNLGYKKAVYGRNMKESNARHQEAL